LLIGTAAVDLSAILGRTACLVVLSVTKSGATSFNRLSRTRLSKSLLAVVLLIFSASRFALAQEGQIAAGLPPVTTRATTSSDQTLCQIIIQSVVDTGNAEIGQPVEAILKNSLQMTPNYNAPPGSRVLGHITDLLPERTQAQALFSEEQRLRTDSGMAIVFDEVICPDARHFKINARLAKQSVTVPAAEGTVRAIKVNAVGQVVHGKQELSLKERTTNIVGQNAIQIATLATGGASLVIAPVALGAAGVISPRFTSNRPDKPEEKHPRLKGFWNGVLDALPGVPLVQAFVVHGAKTNLLPGDELLMSCSPVGIVPADEAAVRISVHGIVMPPQHN
jgi:hypothetical protein